MKKVAYNVATRVLVDQAFVILRLLNVEGTAKRRADLAQVGLDAADFTNALKTSAKALQLAETLQESAKQSYLREAGEDAVLAEAGYRYKLAFDARVRTHLSKNEGHEELRGLFRFGKLRSARARSVVYELLITLHEANKLDGMLASSGITPEFLAKGQKILDELEAEKAETAEQKDARMTATEKVRALEIEVSQQLAQLVAADEAIALEEIEEGLVFRLDTIRTEEARLAAARTSRAIASSAPLAE